MISLISFIKLPFVEDGLAGTWGDHILRTWFLFCVLLRFFSFPRVHLGTDAMTLFQRKAMFVMLIVKNFESSSKHEYQSWRRYSLLPKKLLVPMSSLAAPRPGVSHSAWFPKLQNLNCCLELTVEHSYCSGPGWNYPAALCDIKLLSKSSEKEMTFSEDKLGDKLYGHFSK